MKKFRLEGDPHEAEMVECEFGEFVKLEEAESLERERNEARKEAEWARGLIDGWSEASVTKFPWENAKGDSQSLDQ
jgi:hypothetical protein